MIKTEALRESFRRLYFREARLFRAPGRVNLIGEHTDYNEGFVLPIAIDRATTVAAAARDDRRVRAYSLNFEKSGEFDLDVRGSSGQGLWMSYVEGVARELDGRTGGKLRGADLLISSDVPIGAGLSSSAALEISVGLALLSLSEIELGGRELALAGQAAEHNWVGIKSGIMDQMISVMGQSDHALLLDCRSLETTGIPLDTSRNVFVVCDTRVRHTLASSEYNRRRLECEEGVAALRQSLPGVRALRDVTLSELEAHASLLSETIMRRCRHVVTENARTLAAAAALRQGAMEEMGRLMYESHASLSLDYEVSCRELDLMVEIASGHAGVLGARMTGGGFGGSTVSLVERERLYDFRRIIKERYGEATGLESTVYAVEASGGCSEIGTD